MKTSSELKGTIFILMATSIWGFSFVAQKAATEFLDPFAFTGLRSFLGAATMLVLMKLPIQGLSSGQKSKEPTKPQRHLLLSGLAGGVLLSCCISLQQMGLEYTDAGKAAFISAFYILLVPLCGIFLHQKVEKKIWLCVFLALAGFYVMCMTDGLSAMNIGDAVLLLATFFSTIHIYLLDYISKEVDVVRFNCIQFFVAGILCTGIALVIEQPAWSDVLACAGPLLYAGIMNCGLGYLFQILGQRHLRAAKASLLLSTESVFALFCGMIFLHEVLLMKDVIGCTLIFVAIVISQLELQSERKRTDVRREQG